MPNQATWDLLTQCRKENKELKQKVQEASDTIGAYNENAKDANLDYALSLLQEVLDSMKPEPKPKCVMVYYNVIHLERETQIDYELNQRGNGIRTLTYPVGGFHSASAHLLDELARRFGYDTTEHRAGEWKDPPDWDGVPMEYRLILNPSTEDE